MEPTVRFERKQNSLTNWIVVEHDEGNVPPVVRDLQESGWDTDEDRGFAPVPALDGVEETKLGKRGTDLFAGWTPDEKRENMKEARRILRRHGYTRVPVNTLTLADLL